MVCSTSTALPLSNESMSADAGLLKSWFADTFEFHVTSVCVCGAAICHRDLTQQHEVYFIFISTCCFPNCPISWIWWAVWYAIAKHDTFSACCRRFRFAYVCWDSRRGLTTKDVKNSKDLLINYNQISILMKVSTKKFNIKMGVGYGMQECLLFSFYICDVARSHHYDF